MSLRSVADCRDLPNQAADYSCWSPTLQPSTGWAVQTNYPLRWMDRNGAVTSEKISFDQWSTFGGENSVDVSSEIVIRNRLSWQWRIPAISDRNCTFDNINCENRDLPTMMPFVARLQCRHPSPGSDGLPHPFFCDSAVGVFWRHLMLMRPGQNGCLFWC